MADAFEYLCSHSDTVNQQTARSLLFLTLRSRCLDTLRHEKVQQSYAEYMRHATEHDADDNYAEFEERNQLVSEALNNLPERTRNMVEACFVEKKTYEEVGRYYGISKHGVRKHVYCAIETIRSEIFKKT